MPGRQTIVRAYPVSVEWPNRWVCTVRHRSRPAGTTVRRQLAPGIVGVGLGVGVDRLDYTKGIEEKFLAVERLLEIAAGPGPALRLRAACGTEPGLLCRPTVTSASRC